MASKTIQQIEDEYELSRHYEIKVDGDAVLRDNKNVYEALQHLEAIEKYLVVEPDNWAGHIYIDIND
ncbi:hypothetical protein ABLV94_07250 [Staphylococcus sp. Mo2-7]|uniref:hypothetical protein n=1 Tax=Staphylococcus sp. Mo2-6 TaxID=3135641 RepID=UPI003367E7BA